MDIYHVGLTAIRIKGKKTTLVVDPFTKETAGLKWHQTPSDAVLLTSSASWRTPHIRTSAVDNYRVVIDGPGEYEVGGVAIVGIPIGQITSYYIKIDGIALLHLGLLDIPLSDSEFDRYPAIDILFVSVSSEAPRLVTKLEPKIIVPMNFTQASMAPFLKELGKEDVKPQPKLTTTREKLPAELEVVVLRI